jgi:hypothetical protein
MAIPPSEKTGQSLNFIPTENSPSNARTEQSHFPRLIEDQIQANQRAREEKIGQLPPDIRDLALSFIKAHGAIESLIMKAREINPSINQVSSSQERISKFREMNVSR